MELAEAVAMALREELKWVAVDRNNKIYGYTAKPITNNFAEWHESKWAKSVHLGHYTGTLYWKNTLTRVA